MLLILAWKNIWRNKKRSLIILVAMIFGLWGGLMAGALMMGMGESIVNSAIDRDLAHIQIHHNAYPIEKEMTNIIPDGPSVVAEIRNIAGVKAVSGRTLIEGMAASPASSFGVTIVGIIPDEAKQTTNLPEKIIAGDYFESDRKNPIVIGQKLATRLNLKLNSKIVLSFQGLDVSFISVACRVVGIFKTESALFDEMNVFVLQGDLFRVLETTPIIHEIAVRTTSVKIMPQVAEMLKTKYDTLLVQTWREIAPEIAVVSVMMIYSSYVFVGIILLALLFGITNTMLMSVVDRIRELGMLIAVGMKKRYVFAMILLETIFLSITGGLGGMAISGVSIRYFSLTGIDFSAFASGFESFGASAMVYPFLPVAMYIILTLMIIATANIAALLPAWKAIHIQPSEAIRTY
ncbi:efflux ABC transporter, permease protein [Candidatus Vecturithrix granuli]|uniref:Efflux ABC transporter, permease protein n=1 Tax=Vecturithrix granuli TaxID=1499967 RepID=A0A0S6WB64_VECG1|nr:efflux ABC transporter, permease protein [Candidatus Vecturithrix granuli]